MKHMILFNSGHGILNRIDNKSKYIAISILLLSVLLAIGLVFAFIQIKQSQDVLLDKLSLQITVPNSYSLNLEDEYSSGGLRFANYTLDDSTGNSISIMSMLSDNEIKEFLKTPESNMTGGRYTRIYFPLTDEYTFVGNLDGKRLYRNKLELNTTTGKLYANYYIEIDDNNITNRMNIFNYKDDPDELNILVELKVDSDYESKLAEFDKIISSINRI